MQLLTALPAPTPRAGFRLSRATPSWSRSLSWIAQPACPDAELPQSITFYHWTECRGLIIMACFLTPLFHFWAWIRRVTMFYDAGKETAKDWR